MYEIGDWVVWTSQAGGSELLKRGTIVEVVPGRPAESREIPVSPQGVWVRPWAGAQILCGAGWQAAVLAAR